MEEQNKKLKATGNCTRTQHYKGTIEEMCLCKETDIIRYDICGQTNR